MLQSVKCVLSYVELNSYLKLCYKNLGMVADACDLGTGEAETRESQTCRPASLVKLVNFRFSKKPIFKK